jgi:uncharacterized protein YbjQ (UPF0145 family)
MTPAELLIARSHGVRPIASIASTCWMHYGWSWTEGHAAGWATALDRMRNEAIAAGANAVVDVKMRTVPLPLEASMDFSLIGTAVRIEGLPPSAIPVVATVPALEFVRLLEADVVPTGIAVGAHYDWLTDWNGSTNMTWMGNTEIPALSRFWESVRHRAHADLRRCTGQLGNGALAHVNFGQMIEFKEDNNQPKRYLVRHIVAATAVDVGPHSRIPQDIQMVVDLRDDSALLRTPTHHQSYTSNHEEEGAI